MRSYLFVSPHVGNCPVQTGAAALRLNTLNIGCGMTDKGPENEPLRGSVKSKMMRLACVHAPRLPLSPRSSQASSRSMPAVSRAWAMSAGGGFVGGQLGDGVETADQNQALAAEFRESVTTMARLPR